MQSLQKQIGLRVRELREKKGISQEALAANCGLHRTYVGLVERGQRNLSLATLEKISEGLGAPVSELFSEVQHPTSKPAHTARKGMSMSGDVGAHLATIRQILIDAKLTDAKRYEAVYKANREKGSGPTPRL